MVPYELIFPEYLSGYEHETEAKGYLTGVKVVLNGRSIEFVVYDQVRLMQEVGDEMGSSGFFSEARLIVVRRVTKAEIESVIQRLSAGDFHDYV
jgi:hypothetical protein